MLLLLKERATGLLENKINKDKHCDAEKLFEVSEEIMDTSIEEIKRRMRYSAPSVDYDVADAGGRALLLWLLVFRKIFSNRNDMPERDQNKSDGRIV